MTAIPEYRWGNIKALNKGAILFASTKPGSWAIRKLMPLDRKVMVKTRGKRSVLGPVGVQSMLLESIGRKSGQKRVSPLLYARDGESIIVVGSNFGQEHHPAWTGNLIANPDANIIIGGVEVPVRAERLRGADADAGFATMVESASVYAVYKTRTDRELRVFRLTAR
ncbi:nitroreductase/quinone reductase family protein [Demetria terragena]|uniref:nitroreductase/quinone reductase family protein n=1 Tax=Demetria terragena TaxID=63959 RepID=UPI0003747981|nr:nitroreductase/quinone reductase family protein [Demetria terragena]